MQIEYFYGSKWWCRAHRAGCSDTLREARKEGDGRIGTTEVDSHRALIEEVAGDFIFDNSQQPWTDYIDEVSLAPCIKGLPLEVTG